MSFDTAHPTSTNPAPAITGEPAVSAAEVYVGLAARCCELGVPLWHVDRAGKIASTPVALFNEIAGWLANPALAARVESAANQFFASAPTPVNRPPAIEISPGRFLVGVAPEKNSWRSGVYLALAITSRDGDAPAQLRARGEQDVAQLSLILSWSCDELVRARRDTRTIDQFCEKLAQAYEETNLMYRMARLLNGVSDPGKSIQTISQQLLEVTPFTWLAIRFSRSGRGVAELAGRTIVVGRAPCGAPAIDKLADDMLVHHNEETWVKMLRPGHDPLADAVGAEVLAEPITGEGRVIGVLLAGNKTGPDAELSSFETQLFAATADFVGLFHENVSRFAEQQETFIGTLRALTASIDAKDRYTRGHSERVGLLASQMAAAIELDASAIEMYRIAGLVHDVGKIGVPEAVLCKPGRLTDEEFAQIKLHPGIGFDILKDIPSLQAALPGVLSHHERWDGRGYPHNLAGEQIPLIARILALADTFDAMSSNRSYRPAMPRQRVLEEITNNAGRQFDPALTAPFVGLDFSEFDAALEADRLLQQAA